MAFAGAVFSKLFEWDTNPVRNEKIFNARLEAEFDGIATGLSEVAGDLIGGQISFPAVQSASADANTLDDYEEGPFTPDVTFATPGDLAITWTVQSGFYTKIGREVTIIIRLVSTTFTHTTAAGDIQITNLPFTSANVTNNISVGSMQFGGINKAGGFTQVTPRVNANSTIIILTASGMGVAAATVNVTDVPTTSAINFVITMTYFAAT